MKLECSDSKVREFFPLKDLFLKNGFDPIFLDKDENLVMYDLSKNHSKLDHILLARQGVILEGEFFHWGKSHRKINPVSITPSKLLKSGDWISFLPSIALEKESSIHGKMNFLTKIFRFLYKFSKNSEVSRFEDYILRGKRINEFSFNYGYKVEGFVLDKDLLLLSDAALNIFAVHITVLGFVDKIYVCLND